MRPSLSQLPKHPNNIGTVIKRHGWKLDQVATQTGIPRRTLIDYCQGRTAVPKDRREKLATCLSYPASYLVPHFREAYLLQSQEDQAKDEQALLVLQTHCKAHPTDENALRELMVMLAMHGRSQEIEQYYARLLTELNQFTRRGPEPSTSALMEELCAQLTPAPEKMGQASPTNIGPTTNNGELLPPSSGHIASSSSQSVSSQGILVREANAPSLDAKNLRDCYLVSSTDIVPSLKVYSTYCQGELTACRQQIDIYETIEQRSTMSDEQSQLIDASEITRRDLFMLAVVSPSLLTNMRRGWPTAGIIEEFLSEATASVTTCWYLLQRSDGLPTVELALPQYLPELEALVKSSSLHRQRAAYLAAQGFLLRSLVAHHRTRFAERVVHCQKAVTYASASGDLTLLLTCQTHLGNAFLINGQPEESLKTYLQTEAYSKSTQLSDFLRSKILGELSHPYAKQGNDQEVVRCLDEASATFTEADSETPVFLLADYGRYQTILFEGLSAFDLGSHAKGQGKLGLAQKYWKDAAEKFGKMEQLPSGLSVPVRIAAEALIAQALAYARARNMEGFLIAFEKGVKLAMELGSEKRMQEAREALKAALEQWPNDTRITGLWELLV